jgi:hypothetical protein
MIGGLCKTTLASVGNVSPDEGIQTSRGVVLEASMSSHVRVCFCTELPLNRSNPHALHVRNKVMLHERPRRYSPGRGLPAGRDVE